MKIPARSLEALRGAHGLKTTRSITPAAIERLVDKALDHRLRVNPVFLPVTAQTPQYQP